MYRIHPLSYIFYMVVTTLAQECPESLSNEEEQLVWRNPVVLDEEADPNFITIYDEYIVNFDLDCISRQSNNNNRDVINEFLDLWSCYEENTNDGHIDLYPNIVSHWIEMDKISGCDSSIDDTLKIKWCDYGLLDVEEEEEIQLAQVDDTSNDSQCYPCKIQKVQDPDLWNLDTSYSCMSGATLFLEFPSLFDPNFAIFVMDTGIDETHSEFDGLNMNRIYDGYPNQTLLGGHGTHVAGTIFGNNYGVFHAASTNIEVIDIRILNSDGIGSGASIWNGYVAIYNYLMSNPGKKGIINASFGSGHHPGWQIALDAVRAVGGIIFASAGNDNIDASYKSPASSNATITVGAHNISLSRASFSNSGDLVDIWAPGTDILSAIPAGYTVLGRPITEYKLSGTSMAAPFVSGKNYY